ncbi:hypothetical protein GCM10020370_32190 [Paenibacillus hodogayensis]
MAENKTAAEQVIMTYLVRRRPFNSRVLSFMPIGLISRSPGQANSLGADRGSPASGSAQQSAHKQPG